MVAVNILQLTLSFVRGSHRQTIKTLIDLIHAHDAASQINIHDRR